MSEARHSPAAEPPRADRVRYEVRTRDVAVTHVEHVTPGMLRITCCGEDLADLASSGFDDHVKLLVPTGAGSIERRDYTPRRVDSEAREVVFDFALHDAGPATGWARGAKPGDRLRFAGPKGSRNLVPHVRRWLLIGDETALPAIGRLHEEVGANAEITSLVAVTGSEEEQVWVSAVPDARTHWVHRAAADAADPEPLLLALSRLSVEPDTYVWIAAEASVARAVRAHVLAQGHPIGWLKAAGYWMSGEAGKGVKLDERGA